MKSILMLMVLLSVTLISCGTPEAEVPVTDSTTVVTPAPIADTAVVVDTVK